MSTSDINRSALEFVRTMSAPVKEICASLQEVGIRSFSYGRFYDDGRRLYLSNNLEWIEVYFQKELYNDPEQLKFYVPPLNTRYLVWPGENGLDKTFLSQYLNSSPFRDGFSIYDFDDFYLDYFGFGGDLKSNSVQNYFLNHLNYFEDFIKKFRKIISNVIKSKDQSRLILPKKLISFSQKRRPPLIETAGVEKFKKTIGFISH